MFQKCGSAKKLTLVISILLFSALLLLFRCNFNINLAFPRLLNQQIRDQLLNEQIREGVIASGKKQEERNARHENDLMLPHQNEIEVIFGQMQIYLCLSTDIFVSIN